MELADVPVSAAFWESPFVEHWADVPLAEKVDMLVGVTATMQGVAGIALARAELGFFDTEKWFVSSQGHRIHQHIVESGGGYDATALGERETQRRSYPQSFGQYDTGGYETVRAWDYPGNAAADRRGSRPLLTADECPEGEKTLILEGSQLALQIHESVGHAIELDRILGWEAAFAGTSHLDLALLGKHRYGSEIMQITADATIPGALGTFGYDDEGTPAQLRGHRQGRHLGRGAVRPRLGRPGRAAARGHGAGRRLQPAPHGADDQRRPARRRLVARGDDRRHRDGIYMATNRSWSIDDRRLNFQFGTEIGWEIKDGQAGPDAEEPHLHRDHPAVLGAAGHARRGGRAGPLGDAQLRQGPADADRPHRALGFAGTVRQA